MQMEIVLSYTLLGLNILTFLFYGVDKLLAIFKMWRIPESTLLFMTFIGGAVGALISMLLFRHKIRKGKFWLCAILSLTLHVALAVYLATELPSIRSVL